MRSVPGMRALTWPKAPLETPRVPIMRHDSMTFSRSSDSVGVLLTEILFL
jgi:hypothetical protein